MNIIQLTENKKQYMNLLLFTNEQESTNNRYLKRRDIFVLEDGSIQIVRVDMDKKQYLQTKNIAITPKFQ